MGWEANGEQSPINIAVLGRQTLDDTALQVEVLHLFVEQAQAFAALAAAGHDRAAVLAGLHRLKGASRSVGAEAVAEVAEQLEAKLSRQSADAAFDPRLSEPVRSAIAEACRFAAMWVSRFG